METDLIKDANQLVADGNKLLQDGGVVGLLVTAIVITIGLVLRYKGWIVPAGKSDGLPQSNVPEIKALSSRVALVDKRLADVERDIQHLPTRDEMHQFELSLTRLDGRFGVMEDRSKATASAIARIEDFMIDVSKRSKK